MKNNKFTMIGSVALATIGAYVATKGFQNAIEVSNSTELNIIQTTLAATELAVSTVLFKNSIKRIRKIFIDENKDLKSLKNNP